MIKSMRFRNFKALRDCVLPLGRFTLLVGPNGSGKSTVLQALTLFGDVPPSPIETFLTLGASPQGEWRMLVEVELDPPVDGQAKYVARIGAGSGGLELAYQTRVSDTYVRARKVGGPTVRRARIYSLDATNIATPVKLFPNIELAPSGSGLPGVLDRLRDNNPERWEALNEEVGRWIPEFDRILFDTPGEGQRAIALRMRDGGHKVPAGSISQGTLLALAILTLAYLPKPPPIIGLEEPDRGLHPRLLRDVRDAIYRLAYPENFGEKRDPVQVIATTHSPYMLDLFRDHPEEIVIANKVKDNVVFERLSDRPDVDEILGEARLGDVWYSGILGGVPSEK